MYHQFVRLASVLLSVFLLQDFAAAFELVAEIHVLNHQVVVGEPFVVDLIVRNDSQAAIQSRCANDISFGLLEPIVEVYDSDGVHVAAWRSHGSSSIDSVYNWRIKETGKWVFQLEPGDRLRSRQLAIPTLDDADHPHNLPDVDSGPLLNPGRYTLVGNIPWVDGNLKTAPVSVHVVRSQRVQDNLAAAAINREWLSFMGGATRTGMRSGWKHVESGDIKPYGKVKLILEEFADSIHASFGRSQLLLHRQQAFSRQPDRSGTTQIIKTNRRVRMLKMVTAIETHLQQNPNDPLELNLLQARIILLRMFEVFDPLNKALFDLIEKYPKSTYAEQARDMQLEIAKNRFESEAIDISTHNNR